MSFGFGSGSTGFSFGAAPASSAAASTGFSFGAAPASSAAASTGFSFGAAPASSAAASTGFSFGAAPASAAAPAAGGFSFGAAPASTPATTGGFSFGAAPASSAAATGGFSFGAAPAASAATTSSFGFGAAPTAASTAGGFSFGSPAKTTTSFGFGAAPAAAAPASTGFSFGAPAAQPAATTGFSFGAAPAGGQPQTVTVSPPQPPQPLRLDMTFASLPEEHKAHVIAMDNIIRGMRTAQDSVAEQLRALAAIRSVNVTTAVLTPNGAAVSTTPSTPVTADALMQALSELNLSLTQDQELLSSLEHTLKQEQEDMDAAERLTARALLEASTGSVGASIYASPDLTDAQALPSPYQWSQLHHFVTRINTVGEQIAEITDAVAATQDPENDPSPSLVASVLSEQYKIVLALAAKVGKLSSQVESFKASALDALRARASGSRPLAHLFASRRATADCELIPVSSVPESAAPSESIVIQMPAGAPGQPSAAAPATAASTGFSGFGFGSTAPAATAAATTSSFGFGAAPAATTASTGGFSFGAAPASSAASAGGFSFGATPASTSAVSSFSLGGSAASAPASTGFSFGAPSTPATGTGFSMAAQGNSSSKRRK